MSGPDSSADDQPLNRWSGLSHGLAVGSFSARGGVPSLTALRLSYSQRTAELNAWYEGGAAHRTRPRADPRPDGRPAGHATASVAEDVLVAIETNSHVTTVGQISFGQHRPAVRLSNARRWRAAGGPERSPARPTLCDCPSAGPGFDALGG